MRQTPQAGGRISLRLKPPPCGQTGPNEYYFGGAACASTLRRIQPGPQNVGLGVVERGRFADGKWETTRWIAGDDDAQGKSLSCIQTPSVRVRLYRLPINLALRFEPD